MVLPAGTLKRLHVNQHLIRSNKAGTTDLPPLTVKTSAANHKAWHVIIDGPSEMVYSPAKPLSCGARVWVQTRAQVRLDEDTTA